MLHTSPLQRTWKKLLLLVISLMIVLPVFEQPAAVKAASTDVQSTLESRTKSQIVEKWLKYKPMELGRDYMNGTHIFTVEPKLTAPYAAGKLKDSYIKDGINAVNFIRYLAGLPDDVEADWSIEQQQQTGALVNAVNQVMSHYPQKPAGMNDVMHQLGYDANRSSNLYYGSPTFYDNVLGYMSDSDSNNIDRVGHRRWILNPQMKKTMFGMVFSRSSSDSSSLGVRHATMYAFDKQRPAEDVSYNYISWPPAGYTPMEVFAASDAWSVSINPNLYDRTKTEDITVTLTRDSDQKSWSFNHNDRDVRGKFFNVETSYFGIPFSIIFRPDALEAMKNDEAFHVSINGLYTKTGLPASVAFKTTFFKMLSTYTARDSIVMESGETLTPLIENAITGSTMDWSSSDPKIVKVDKNGKLTAIAKGDAIIYFNSYLRDGSMLNVSVVDSDPSDKVSAWAAKEVKKAKEAGLVPRWFYYNFQSPMYREGFVEFTSRMAETVLGISLYEQKYEYGRSPFQDVDYWAVSWAADNGIISGTGKNKFSPYDSISREQAAKLLLNVYHYLAEKTGRVPVQKSSQTIFSDDSKISDWAKADVYEAVSLNLLNGVDNNRFNPKGSITTEQTIIILYRLFEQFYEQS